MKWEDIKWRQGAPADTRVAYVEDADAGIGLMPDGTYYICARYDVWNNLDIVAAQCVLIHLAEERK
jgi:hypothetical protein